MASKLYETVREERVVPQGLTEETLLLAPADLQGITDQFFLTWPLFFDYDLDADQLIAALKGLCQKYPFLCGRLRPSKETRFVVKIHSNEVDSCWIPFLEMRSDMSMATAIVKHGKVKSKTADFPVVPDLPFIMDSIDYAKLITGEAPMAKFRLIHFSDGCALTLTISHILVDAQRYVELMANLSRAYRGLEVPDRDHDRSRFWPDQLAKHFTFLGEEVANLPRMASQQKEKINFTQYPEECCTHEVLYFSKEVLDKMKATVKPFLPEAEFVSSSDLLSSLLWMLKCEGDRQESGDGSLDLTDTMCAYMAELLANGVHVIPENFVGNAVAILFLSTQGLELEDKPLPELFATLAQLMRKNTIDFREQPQLQAQSAMVFYVIVSTGTIPVAAEKMRSSVSSLLRMPLNDVDFGNGPPRMAHFISPLPFIGIQSTLGPAPGNDKGILAYVQFTESQYARLKNSRVLQQCAPGAKLLTSEMTADEIDAMFKS